MYKATDKICDLMAHEEDAIQIISRFGLEMGVGEQTIEQVCEAHNVNYGKLVTACEQAYQKFERDGSYTLATQELVDELTAQVETLTAEYEAMKKDRNSWMKKYNELNAEFEEYKRTHPDTDGGDE